MVEMDMNQQSEMLDKLIRLNLEAQRELVEVADSTSARWPQVASALNRLNEQLHLLLQQRAEQLLTDPMAGELSEMPGCLPQEKRGRGAPKRYYLKEETAKTAFLAQVRLIFQRHYVSGKRFRLPDGSQAKAHHFMACLFDLGIKLGIAPEEAPVKDFCEMVTAVAHDCPTARDFDTAYNTVQRAIKQWNPLTGQPAFQLYCTTVRFHQIARSSVPANHLSAFDEWTTLYDQVEQIYRDTEDRSK